MRSIPRLISALTLAVVLGGCSPYLVNGKLDRFDKDAGYRYGKLSGEGNSDEIFVILAFSGGGTRAAAFSFGVMEGLQGAVYNAPGGPRRFLEDVDVISSVSGGSFTAAYYALFPEKFFATFPFAFLHRNVQGDLIRRALWPPNWFRLAASDFDRINLAAEYYDETIFEHKTFAELIAKRRKPYIILNATDMTLGRRFEFSQDQFDLLCSDLASVKVATAVAASSAFPGLLSPLTVKNFAADGCKYERPQWLTDALDRNNPIRRYANARDLWSYQDPKLKREYIHLLDGGLGDNIGLRGPYVSLSGNDSNWSLYDRINQRSVRRIVVISANAKTNPSKDWDHKQAAPGILDVLSLVTGGPMDNYSFETVQLIRDTFDRLKDEEKAWTDCKQLLQDQCSAKMPGVLSPVDFYASELSFDSLADEDLRLCMENLPTSFYLPEDTVTLVRQVARLLLMQSPDFGRIMRELDGAWQPSAVQIDPSLRARVCPS